MPPRLIKSALPSTNSIPFAHAPFPRCQCLRHPLSRPFCLTTPRQQTRQTAEMYAWLNGPGAVFKDALPGSTNYLNAYSSTGQLVRLSKRGRGKEEEDTDGAVRNDSEEGAEIEEQPQNLASGRPIPHETLDDLMPFPLNKHFRSQSVLSEELKVEIYRRVVERDQSVRTVSAALGVEMRRVGAVVRLKSVEAEWVKKGKPLAGPYSRAVMAMLPQTPYSPTANVTTHESINDLPVHRATLRQLFHPVSESRHFTRTDAGKVFAHDLLPADDRIPHPELVELERDNRAGVIREERILRQQERNRIENAEREERERKRRERAEREVKVVKGSRWEFRFRDVNVDSMGKDGRDSRGVGMRYGVPHHDRKGGQVKIPTRVEG